MAYKALVVPKKIDPTVYRQIMKKWSDAMVATYSTDIENKIISGHKPNMPDMQNNTKVVKRQIGNL